jgi:hypothetical protein
MASPALDRAERRAEVLYWAQLGELISPSSSVPRWTSAK